MSALSDYMIARPEARAYEAAEFFNVTEAWLSTVKNSDAFIQFHRNRREAHFDRISTDVGDKLQGLAEITLDELTERVESQREGMSIQALHDVGKMAISALGFGSRGTVVNVNNDNRSVMVQDTAALERSRERLALIRKQNDEELLRTRVDDVTSKQQEKVESGDIVEGVAVG